MELVRNAFDLPDLGQGVEVWVGFRERRTILVCWPFQHECNLLCDGATHADVGYANTEGFDDPYGRTTPYVAEQFREHYEVIADWLPLGFVHPVTAALRDAGMDVWRLEPAREAPPPPQELREIVPTPLLVRWRWWRDGSWGSS